VLLADRFHYTLEYIDSLPDDDLAELLGVIDGKEKALADIRRHG